jgi:hypothetical protein
MFFINSGRIYSPENSKAKIAENVKFYFINT